MDEVDKIVKTREDIFVNRDLGLLFSLIKQKLDDIVYDYEHENKRYDDGKLPNWKYQENLSFINFCRKLISALVNAFEEYKMERRSKLDNREWI